MENGVRRDPPLSVFEAEIAKYHVIQNEILVCTPPPPPTILCRGTQVTILIQAYI